MNNKLFLCTLLASASIFASKEPPKNHSYTLSDLIGNLNSKKSDAVNALIYLRNNCYSFDNISEISGKCRIFRVYLKKAAEEKFNGFTPDTIRYLRDCTIFDSAVPQIDKIIPIYQRMLERYADKAVDCDMLINQQAGSYAPPPLSIAQEAQIQKIKEGTGRALIIYSNLETIRQTIIDIHNLIDQIPEPQEQSERNKDK